MKHVHNQSDECLSKQIMTEQLKNDWPGLTKIASDISNELNVQGLFDHRINKKQFKQSVKKACIRASDDELKCQLNSYKKMSAIRDEITKGNGYFYNETLFNARRLFRFRVDLFEAKLNFKNNPQYRAEKYLCDSCESEIDQNTHVLFCSSYSALREGKDLNNDAHLAQYLQSVLEIRTKLRLDR